MKKRNVLLLLTSRISLQTLCLNDILFGTFTLSNSIILVEDLLRSNRSFEILLIDQYAGDIGNKNVASKY